MLTQQSMVIGCMRLTDVSVINTIRIYGIRDKNYLAGLPVRSVQPRRKTLN